MVLVDFVSAPLMVVQFDGYHVAEDELSDFVRALTVSNAGVGPLN
jgi:hypothetical protein